VGTTVTAAMATIGGSTASKRSGYSHVIYNLLTGIMAFMLLIPYTLLWEQLLPGKLVQHAEVALVGFHTAFNVIGVIAVLPFTGAFTRMIQTLIPDQADAYTKSLDKRLVREPDVALTAVLTSVHIELLALLKHLSTMLDKHSKHRQVALAELQTALDETHAYVDLIHLEKNHHPSWKILLAIIHSLDHMQRLHERCEEDVDRAEAAKRTSELAPYLKLAAEKIHAIIEDMENNNWHDAEQRAAEMADALSKQAKGIRDTIMMRVGEGELSVNDGTDRLEAVRWLSRVSMHVLRVMHHQVKAQDLLTKP
jgi:phosphate:Na+ symporter